MSIKHGFETHLKTVAMPKPLKLEPVESPAGFQPAPVDFAEDDSTILRSPSRVSLLHTLFPMLNESTHAS